MRGHLEAAELSRLAAGKMQGGERAAAEEHLGACVECATRLGEASQGTAAVPLAVAPGGSSPTIVRGSPPSFASAQSGPRIVAGEKIDLDRAARIGRYVLLGQLGSGGMGVVYAAYDPQLDRRIALKLMRADAGGGQPEVVQARLLREAQAMAALDHPNVVAVHDVGTFGEQVFVAMEIVDGETLTDWLRRPRPWRETLAVMVQAGRGLAAAHRVQLVHGDFKPDNVLVGKDGVVRVSDFGLARKLGSADPVAEPTTLPGSAPSEPDSGPFSARLTIPGFVMGTPEYMSPELHLGRRADEKSDQFAFCVTLYRALFGVRPFAGETLAELAVATTRGTIIEPPDPGAAPAWVRRAVVRGLLPDAAARHPSMEALLDTLGRDPAVPRRRAAIAVGIALFAVALAAGVYQAGQRRSRVCRGAEERLEGRWDGPRRDAVRAAFLATAKPFAADAFRAAAAALDDYARRWVEMRTEACEATQLRGDQSQEALDLRISCLDSRLQEVSATTDLLLKADAQLVEKSLAAVQGISGLAPCANVIALRAMERLPPAPAQRQAAEALGAKLAAVRALEVAGRLKDALAQAPPLVAEARSLGHRPLLARALILLSRIEVQLADDAGAEKNAAEALEVAEIGRDELAVAEAATLLLRAIGHSGARCDEALRWGRVAAAVLSRVDDATAAQATLAAATASTLKTAGRNVPALASYREAAALHEKAHGRESYEYAGALIMLASAIANGGGDPDEALRMVKEGTAIDERVLGPRHPTTSWAHERIGRVLFLADRKDESLAEFGVALAGYREAYGERSMRVADALRQMSGTLKNKGDLAGAVDHASRALAIQEEVFGKEHVQLIDALVELADDSLQQKKPKDGLAFAERAVAIGEKAFGENGPLLSGPLLLAGEAWIDLGIPSRAVPLLERSVKLQQDNRPDPANLGAARFFLAKAVWNAGGDRQKARRIALAARDDLQRSPGGREGLPEVDAWLAKH